MQISLTLPIHPCTESLTSSKNPVRYILFLSLWFQKLRLRKVL